MMEEGHKACSAQMSKGLLVEIFVLRLRRGLVLQYPLHNPYSNKCQYKPNQVKAYGMVYINIFSFPLIHISLFSKSSRPMQCFRNPYSSSSKTKGLCRTNLLNNAWYFSWWASDTSSERTTYRKTKRHITLNSGKWPSFNSTSLYAL